MQDNSEPFPKQDLVFMYLQYRAFDNTVLSLSQTTNSGLFQTERVCRRQFAYTKKQGLFGKELTFSLLHYFETAPNSKNLQTTTEMGLLTLFLTIPTFNDIKKETS